MGKRVSALDVRAMDLGGAMVAEAAAANALASAAAEAAAAAAVAAEVE